MNQMSEVQVQHPSLELMLISGKLRVCGMIGFCVDHNSRTVEDTYQIELRISNDYPESPPTAFEIENKIPKDFEHFMPDGSLCLGAPIEIRRKFFQHKSLLRFINDQLVPYLFSYSYKRDHGETPFGELSHGGQGIREYYQDLFEVDDHIAVLGLLKVLADDSYRGHFPCPCGGKSNLRRCHGQLLRELSSFQSCKQFSQDVMVILESFPKSDLQVVIGRRLLPKSVLKEINRRQQRRKKYDQNRRRRSFSLRHSRAFRPIHPSHAPQNTSPKSNAKPPNVGDSNVSPSP